MGSGSLRRWGGYMFIAVAAAVVLGSLFLLARSAENSAQFSDWIPWIVGLNTTLVALMAALLARRVYRLVSDLRRNVPGSRLTVRTVAVFSGLVIVPLLVIYGFARYSLDQQHRQLVQPRHRTRARRGPGQPALGQRRAQTAAGTSHRGTGRSARAPAGCQSGPGTGGGTAQCRRAGTDGVRRQRPRAGGQCARAAEPRRTRRFRGKSRPMCTAAIRT